MSSRCSCVSKNQLVDFEMQMRFSIMQDIVLVKTDVACRLRFHAKKSPGGKQPSCLFFICVGTSIETRLITFYFIKLFFLTLYRIKLHGIPRIYTNSPIVNHLLANPSQCFKKPTMIIWISKQTPVMSHHNFMMFIFIVFYLYCCSMFILQA